MVWVTILMLVGSAKRSPGRRGSRGGGGQPPHTEPGRGGEGWVHLFFNSLMIQSIADW